jgi:predicted nucleotidyltransferase
MKTVAEITSRIRAVKPVLFRNGIERIGLFGSVMRGEGGKNSDLDVLLHFRNGCENFSNFNHACEVLEAAFPDTKVDVVTANGLSPYIGPYILAEVVYV